MRGVQHISRASCTAAPSQSAHHEVLYRSSHAHYQTDVDYKPQLETLGSKTPVRKSSRKAFANPLSELSESPRGLSSQSAKQNPFVVADKAATKSSIESRISKQSADQRCHYQGLSQKRTDGLDYEISCTEVECDDPMCRATHDGHYPYRHSIACALHRSDEVESPRASSRESIRPDNASIIDSPNAQRAKDHTFHRHHLTVIRSPHHTAEYPTSEVGHDHHGLYTRHAEKSHDETSSRAISPRSVTKFEASSSRLPKPVPPITPSTQMNAPQYVHGATSPGHSRHDSHSKPARNIKDRPKRMHHNATQRDKQSHAKLDQVVKPTVPARPSGASLLEGNTEVGDFTQSSDTHVTTRNDREPGFVESKHTFRDDRGYRNIPAIIEDHVVSKHDTAGESLGSHHASRISDDIQNKRPIPKGNVSSPPSWLKMPRKEAGDAKSRLRHVDTRSHGNLPNFRAISSGEVRNKRPRSSIPKSSFLRESLEELNHSTLDFLRVSAPSPPTASHITHHQRPESWLDDSSEHLRSRASNDISTQTIGTSSISPHGVAPAEERQMSSRHEHSPSHLQIENAGYLRDAFLSPSSARSAFLRPQQSTTQPSSSYESVKGDLQSGVDSESSVFQSTPRATHVSGHYSPSTASRISRSPLQSRHALLDNDEGAMSEYRSSTLEGESEKLTTITGESLDYEIQRPSPIAPPNHDCSWKSRYLALAAEIRLLKAELSTRASLRGTDLGDARQGGEDVANEDDDLGIEGVTIIMHLRGRDDMVINTDLTQE
ncbi:hypothetical protein GGR54DRAFT_637077 [Hypoxylon sp. NC1633]|nr:hypothetical protein GGR54DRAFT_637077 [Hypoxylon sp. NC1633]